MTTWSLPHTFSRELQRWSVLAAFLVVGGLLGVGFSYLWTPSFQATREIAVALNPYPVPSAHSELELSYFDFRNLDDYKNWQMSQLNEFIRSDRVLQATLDRLQSADPAWQDKTTADVRPALSAAWLSAGEWRLIATTSDRATALTLAENWTTTALEESRRAITEAQRLLELERKLRAGAAEQSDLVRRLAALDEVAERLIALMPELAALPSDEPPGNKVRWQMLALSGRAAGFDPAWQSFLSATPPESSPLSDYTAWLAPLPELIANESAALKAQAAAIEAEYDTLSGDYNTAVENSFGLSPNLVLEDFSSPAKITSERHTAVLTLSGALIGLLGWLMWVLLRAGRTDQ